MHKHAWGALLIFILREAYIVILIEQCWSLLNSIMSVNQAKRWNGLILDSQPLRHWWRLSLSWIAPLWGTEQCCLLVRQLWYQQR